MVLSLYGRSCCAATNQLKMPNQLMSLYSNKTGIQALLSLIIFYMKINFCYFPIKTEDIDILRKSHPVIPIYLGERLHL